MAWKNSASVFAGIAVAAIIGAGVAISLLWALLVPVFEAPDENAHFDYAYSLATAGHLLRAGDNAGLLANAPNVLRLSGAVGLPSIAFHPEARMYAGYGSNADRRMLDRIPSAASPGLYTGPHPLRAPINQVYPPGYYAIAAIAMRLGGLPSAGMLSTFDAARFCSVVLLAVGLFVWYHAMRATHIPRLVAVFTTAIVATAPLTSFVSSYVQPDNLAFVLVGLAIWTARNARDRGLAFAAVLWYALTLAALWLTKYQFALILTAATLPAVLFALARMRGDGIAKLRIIGKIAACSAVAIAIAQWSMSGDNALGYFKGPHTLTSAASQAFALGFRPGVHFLKIEFGRAIQDFFFREGTVHASYWGVFGWLDTVITTHRPRVDAFTVEALFDGTVIVLIGMFLALATNGVRIVRFGLRRSWLRAAEVVVSDPIPLAYGAFVTLLIVLYTISSDYFGAQGRDLYPFEPAAVLVTIWYAPKFVRRIRYRRLVSGLGGAALATFCLVYGTVSIDTLLDRYYSPAAAMTSGLPLAFVSQLSVASGGSVDNQLSSDGANWLPYDPARVSAAAPLLIRGWADDTRPPAARPVRGVGLFVDGRFTRWGEAGLRRPDVALVMNAPQLENSGYEVQLPARTLTPGHHLLSLRFIDADGDGYLAPVQLPPIRVVR